MNRGLLLAILIIVGVTVVGLGSWEIYQTSQPGVVVHCANAPRKPLTNWPDAILFRPATLVTAQDYFAWGDYEYEEGYCDQAIEDYSRAINLDPNVAEVYNNRAYVYMVKRDYASALSDLNRAIQLRPNYVNALMNRGDIYNYYYAIDYQKAIADYNHVLAIDPSAKSETSVCGHRLIAVNHGWSFTAIVDLATHGPLAGCLGSTE